MRHITLQPQSQINVVDFLILIYKGPEPPTKYGIKRLIRQNKFKINDKPVTIDTVISLSPGTSFLVEKGKYWHNAVMVEV